MFNLKFKILLLGAILLGVIACDVIPVNEREEKTETTDEWNGQYILLEDFTGVRCVNCPETGEEMEKLKNIFGEKLIVVALHSTGLDLSRPIVNSNITSPDSNGNNQDLRNVKAEEFRLFYNVQAFPNSIFMQRNEMLNKDQLYGKVLSVYKDTAKAAMTVSANSTESTITIGITGSFMCDYSGGDINVSVMILEDELIVAQSTPDGKVDYNYTQNHVLRDMATPAWGTTVLTGAVSSGAGFYLNTSVAINSVWKKNKLNIVAILLDNNTKDVIQVSSVKLQ
jgi:hypothetical protein